MDLNAGQLTRRTHSELWQCTNGAYEESWTFAGTTFSEMLISVSVTTIRLKAYISTPPILQWHAIILPYHHLRAVKCNFRMLMKLPAQHTSSNMI